MAKQEEWARITLRLPQELHTSLVETAGANSLNAEIVSRLEDSFRTADEIKSVELKTAHLVIKNFMGQLRDLSIRLEAREIVDEHPEMAPMVQHILKSRSEDPAADRSAAQREFEETRRQLANSIYKDVIDRIEQNEKQIEQASTSLAEEIKKRGET